MQKPKRGIHPPTFYKQRRNIIPMQSKIDIISDSINAIDGLRCWGIKEGRNGLGIVVCDGVVSGVFTTNRIKAAPVIVTARNIKKGRFKGLIVNSGNANAFTGRKGVENASRMAEMLASKLRCTPEEIAVCSTGVIGRQLDMEWIEKKINEVFPKLENSREAARNFAKAITTTDRFPKEYAVKVGDVVIAGVAKGAGMIAPRMATMLSFIFTDAKLKKSEMDEALTNAVEGSFNVATVDGDTSTNDAVLLVSTGKREIDFDSFSEALTRVCFQLAKLIVRDGEGATKVFEVHVRNAKNDEEAFRAARAIANSLLVKTAIFGCDANWGRIVAAVGYSEIEVTENITLYFENESERVRLLEKGELTGLETEASEFLKNTDDFRIVVELDVGIGKGYAIGCDLSYDYVKLNAEYTT
jgi:glutamate N-acetyltransferase/amino-acid N-acetyltransferase